jgi:hypothetical protein
MRVSSALVRLGVGGIDGFEKMPHARIENKPSTKKTRIFLFIPKFLPEKLIHFGYKFLQANEGVSRPAGLDLETL